MTTKKRFHGRTEQFETPNWEPLLHLARVYVDDFMWMCEIELESGERLHAYKNIVTRRYLHLSEDGRAFVYREPSDYLEIDDLRRMIDLVMPCRIDPEMPRCPPLRFPDEDL